MKIKKIFFISLLLTLFIACTNAPISGRKQLLLVSEEDMINQSYSQYREIIVHSKVLNLLKKLEIELLMLLIDILKNIQSKKYLNLNINGSLT